MGFAVVLDTCALYPAHLRDTLLRLAELGLYQPLWSDDILRELARNLQRNAKINSRAVQRLQREMVRAFPEARVAGYGDLIDSMACHPKDRHVLAAAVRSGAGAILTFNLSDFPDTALEPYELELIHPDAFLLDLLDLAPDLVIGELQRQARANRRSPTTLEGLLKALERADVPDFVDEIRHWTVGRSSEDPPSFTPAVTPRIPGCERDIPGEPDELPSYPERALESTRHFVV